jgi:hypothetical protein
MLHEFWYRVFSLFCELNEALVQKYSLHPELQAQVVLTLGVLRYFKILKILQDSLSHRIFDACMKH